MTYDNNVSIAGIEIPQGSVLRLIHPVTLKPVMGIGWVVSGSVQDRLCLVSIYTGSITEYTKSCQLKRMIAQGRMIVSNEVVEFVMKGGK